MLNDYHLQLLRSLNDHGARYLVIGGQAKHMHSGVLTRDLDIWVDIGEANRTALDQCLVDWSARHPMHIVPPLTHPLDMRPNVQIKIPDADVCYLTLKGSSAQITPVDGIDILTSIGDEDFNAFLQRSVKLKVEDVVVQFVGSDDIAHLETFRA